MNGTRMLVHRPPGPLRLTILAAVLLTACSAAGSTPRPPSSPPGASEPTIEPSAKATSTAAVVPIAEPPAAAIAVDGGDPVTGELGSFAWQNSGSDSPWLGGRPIHIGSGETLAMTLAEPVAIDTWTASRVAAATLDDTATVGIGEGAAGDPVVFAGPPTGTWSVKVSVWFAGKLGSASYYWRVEVD